jgi:hypothetical protein
MGCFFTGGVDSFFSALHFDATAERGQKVDDLIYVWGYDIPLTKRAAFDGKLAALTRVAVRLGKTVTPVITNLRQTKIGQVNWAIFMHGQALGAAGLLLAPKLKTILVSSSQSPEDMRPCGTHRLTTRRMSARTLQFVDYGSDFRRYAKTAFIANSQVALENLHVCWVGQNDTNCGRCEKCCRTLLALELLDCRLQATSFPAGEFSLANVARLKLPSRPVFPLFEEIASVALEKNRTDIATAVTACLAANQSVK